MQQNNVKKVLKWKHFDPKILFLASPWKHLISSMIWNSFISFITWFLTSWGGIPMGLLGIQRLGGKLRNVEMTTFSGFAFDWLIMEVDRKIYSLLSFSWTISEILSKEPHRKSQRNHPSTPHQWLTQVSASARPPFCRITGQNKLLYIRSFPSVLSRGNSGWNIWYQKSVK